MKWRIEYLSPVVMDAFRRITKPRLSPIAVIVLCALVPDRGIGADEFESINDPARAYRLEGLNVTAKAVDPGASNDQAQAPPLADRARAIPELTWRDRGNAAQDVQIQSRGFGARSTFGVRGLRLFLDDVPLSANDGQGSVAAIPEFGIDELRFIRAPESLRYGAGAGGVLIATTAVPLFTPQPALRFAVAENQAGVDTSIGGRSDEGSVGFRLTTSHVEAEGFRPHSAFRKNLAHVVIESAASQAVQWRGSFNLFDMPNAEDPLGITEAQWALGVRGDPSAETFDTRKSVRSAHGGFTFVTPTPLGTLRQTAFIGQRDVVQFLAVPVAVQTSPRHPGGVIDLGRTSGGALTSVAFAEHWLAGLEWGRTREHRKGFENYSGATLGTRGRLRRDEQNDLDTIDGFLVYERALSPQWSLDGALRAGRWSFEGDDRYLANGNDSGQARFDLWSGSIQVAHESAGRARHSWSIGRGQEAPTLNEIAYRTDGSAGPNVALKPSRHTTFEWRYEPATIPGLRSLSVWQVHGRDDLVPAINSGGRATFQNAGATRRRGVDIDYRRNFGSNWQFAANATATDARFREAFSFLVGNDPTPRFVAAGNHIPGIPRAQARADLVYSGFTKHAPTFGVDWIGSTAADDRNTVDASGYLLAHARWRYAFDARFSVGIDVDNLFDRRAIGSVIVNEANGRFLEPADGRRITLTLDWTPD